MNRKDYDYEQKVDGDDLEARVFQDHPELNSGLVLVIFDYESAYVCTFTGNKEELKHEALEIFKSGEIDEYNNELVLYKDGKRVTFNLSW